MDLKQTGLEADEAVWAHLNKQKKKKTKRSAREKFILFLLKKREIKKFQNNFLQLNCYFLLGRLVL